MNVTSQQRAGTISMPDELMRFIQRDTYSLLIKGYAGTGKTTLALTILRALRSRDNFFYISTRISPRQLFEYYPWLSTFVEQSPKPLEPAEASDRVMLPTFEDARLDEPESLFERITNQLMDIKSPIIIIDSWDAIASFMDKEARLNNERVLQTWRERAGAKVIFISEHPDDTTLDFLVDGIVELKQSYYDNVRVREIVMLKLRGIRIDRPIYIYTLENSAFRSFAPYRPLKPQSEPGKKSISRERSTKLIASEYIVTGFGVLDKALGGGFPKKGVVLLELDSHVSTAVAMTFLRGLISDFISNGHPVLFQPFDWVDPASVMNYLQPLPESRKSLFKILWPSNVSGLKNIVMVPSQKRSPAFESVTRMKHKHPGKLLLNIMGTDMIRKSYPSPKDFMNQMEELMSAARAGDLSIVVVSRSQREMLEFLSEVSDIHLRLLMINDTLFVKPLVPASTLYAIEFHDGEIGLQPIV